MTTELYTHTYGSDIAVYDAYRGIVIRTFTAAVGRAGDMTIRDPPFSLQLLVKHEDCIIQRLRPLYTIFDAKQAEH